MSLRPVSVAAVLVLSIPQVCAGAVRASFEEGTQQAPTVAFPRATCLTPPSMAPTGVSVTPPNAVTFLTVSWNPLEELALCIHSYRVDFYTSPSAPAIVSIGAGASLTVSVAGVPAGTYFVSVTGATTGGFGPTSPRVPFTVGTTCTAPPVAPTGLTGAVVGSVASIAFSGSPGATSYIVQVGTAPGLFDLFNATIGSATAASGSVPPGFSAWVRVIAVNACGASPPTPDFHLR